VLTVTNGPCQTIDEVLVTVIATYDLSGTITYNNLANTAMNNCTVKLMKNTTVVATTITDANGNYSFVNQTPDTYTLAVSTVKAWGGVNATDALAVQNHYVGNALLVQPRYGAADVNLSNTVNSTDALFIKKRFSALISSFPSGDWYFHTSAVLLDGDKTYNFKALCYGDVDGSLTPSGAKGMNSLTLTNNGTLSATTGSIVNIPVQVSESMEVGAASMIFTYPSEKLQILSVESNQFEGMITNVVDGKVYVAWSDPTGIVLENTILTINAQILTSEIETIELGLTTESEFANKMAEVISGVEISVPTITTEVTSVNTTIEEKISVYPNPTNGLLNITNVLNSTIELYNVIGEKLVSNQSTTDNTTLDLSKYPSGSYMIRIVKEGKSITKKVTLK
jgi:hypothetical protein